MPARFFATVQTRALAAGAAALMVAGCTEMPDLGPQADYYSTRTQARVYVLDNGDFEVVPPIGAEGAAYWCAASDYARLRLQADYAQDLYVVKGRAPSTVTGRIDTITFSLNGVPRAEEPPFIRRSYSFKPGDSFSVSAAESFCRDLQPYLLF